MEDEWINLWSLSIYYDRIILSAINLVNFDRSTLIFEQETNILKPLECICRYCHHFVTSLAVTHSPNLVFVETKTAPYNYLPFYPVITYSLPWHKIHINRLGFLQTSIGSTFNGHINIVSLSSLVLMAKIATLLQLNLALNKCTVIPGSN